MDARGDDLTITNARLWTAGQDRPWSGSITVRDGRIVALGRGSPEQAFGEVVDAGGRLVTPGIVDAHNHVCLGADPDAVPLDGTKTLDEVHARIRRWLDDHPTATWVHATGFDYAVVGGRHPRADDLAPATRGLPAMVLDYSVHAVVLNREALAAFGITADTVVVPFGTVEHDPQTGQPTGYINDFATMGLSRAGNAALAAVSPAYAPDAQYRGLADALAQAVRLGITTVVEPQNSVDDIALFTRARDQGDMLSRVVAAMFHPVGTTAHEVDEFDQLRRAYDDDHFRVGPIKLYIDDIVEPHTAAMFEPYANRPETNGHTYYDPDDFADVLSGLDARGLQCFVHATGDRGVSMVLDALAEARRRNGARDSRHQIVHVECTRASDLPRFAALGVVACMQPRHCAPQIVDQWRENVGEQRWRYAWPMRTLSDAGAVLAFSSDWNVAEMDPLVGIYTALNRADLDGARSWVPQERLDLATTLRAYTAGSAYSIFADGDRGGLEVGKRADLVVWSDDLFAVEPAALLKARADLTVVGGQIVHRS